MKKTFDCVQMKHEIQERLRQEFAGLTWAERNRRVRAAVAADPHLAKLLRADGATSPDAASGTRRSSS